MCLTFTRVKRPTRLVTRRCSDSRSWSQKNLTMTRYFDLSKPIIYTVTDLAVLRQIIQYLQQQAKTGILAEADMIVLVWNGLMTAVDMSANAGVITDAAVKEITVRVASLFTKL